jgi:hypothetical protein
VSRRSGKASERGKDVVVASPDSEPEDDKVAALRARLEALPGFTVCATRCGECLFSGNRIVRNSTAAMVIERAITRDSYFSCHKFTGPLGVDDDDESRSSHYSRLEVCCRGFFDAYVTKPIALARAFGIVRFVDEDGNEVPEHAIEA